MEEQLEVAEPEDAGDLFVVDFIVLLQEALFNTAWADQVVKQDMVLEEMQEITNPDLRV
jgi:hypothetical protein